MTEYQNLDASQIDLLNKKMQQMETDDGTVDAVSSTKLATTAQDTIINPITASQNITEAPSVVTLPEANMATFEKEEAIKERIAKIERELGSVPNDLVSLDEKTFRDWF